MRVISLAQAKVQLGLTDDTTYDAQITTELPFIDATVKQVTKQNYNFQFYGNMTEDSTTLSVYAYTNDPFNGDVSERKRQYYTDVSGINNPYLYSDVSESLSVGMLIEGDNIPTGAYITDITTKNTSEETGGVCSSVVYIEISEPATATESGVELTGGISIGYHNIIAKGIMYNIQSKSITLPSSGVSSESIGSYSYSLSDVSQKIDGKSGMPAWFVKGLPRFQSGY